MRRAWVGALLVCGCLGPVAEVEQPSDVGSSAAGRPFDAGTLVVDAGAAGFTAFGVAHRDCAPWDGLALRIDITPGASTCEPLLPPVPTVLFSISLWRVDLNPLLPQTVELRRDFSGPGQVSECSNSCGVGEGTLIIERATDTEVQGAYDVMLGGQRRTGRFLAPLCAGQPSCG